MSRTVIVGISGGIAAYKSAYLVSLLKKQGFDVHVIMTENAQKFVSALTFETISGHAAVTDTFKRTDGFEVEHIALAKKADLFIAAPATANLIAKIAFGIADDMLTTTLLAAKCPVVIAPAMNTSMYEDPATQKNIGVLKDRGFFVMDTGEGLLACGDAGLGRMREPEEIAAFADEVLASLYDMHGLKVLISAGPTRESIDPVRYLSNESSGKMGYAIALAALDRGADVTLVSGPVALKKIAKAKTVDVVSAKDMADAMLSLADGADIVIMTAAVADYTPAECSPQKIKKGTDMSLPLIRTTDILKELGKNKKQGGLLMGFAAETHDFEENAKAKLMAKNLDMIALNDVSRTGEGFGAEDNNITLYFNDGTKTDLGSDSKKNLAKRIVEEAYQRYLTINASR